MSNVSTHTTTPPGYTRLTQRPHSLTTLLAVGHTADLGVLADYITDEGQGRLALDSEVTALLNRSKMTGHFDAASRAAIEHELLLFGGNSVVNVFRRLVSGSATNGGAISYEELVRDVAKKLGAPVPTDTNVLGLERRILGKLLQQAFDNAGPNERTAAVAGLPGWSGKAPTVPESLDDCPELWAAIGAVVAGGMGQQLLHRSVLSEWTRASTAGATVAGAAAALRGAATALAGAGTYGAVAGFAGARAVSALAGPVGLAVGGIWTLASLTSPAYRVTVPCVVQLAFMRSNYLALSRVQP